MNIPTPTQAFREDQKNFEQIAQTLIKVIDEKFFGHAIVVSVKNFPNPRVQKRLVAAAIGI